MLGGKEYGLDVLHVEGILPLKSMTPIPGSGAPQYVKGFATMRGKAVPVISARLGMGMAETKSTVWMCIILATLGGNARVGLIVDMICEIVDISSSPAVGGGNEVIGLAKSGGSVTTFLDAGELLANVAACHCRATQVNSLGVVFS